MHAALVGVLILTWEESTRGEGMDQRPELLVAGESNRVGHLPLRVCAVGVCDDKGFRHIGVLLPASICKQHRNTESD